MVPNVINGDNCYAQLALDVVTGHKSNKEKITNVIKIACVINHWSQFKSSHQSKRVNN